jgi:predicted regulator of Ras-like GTPase activity (Roadblock/LC7/MglB family)
MTSRQQTNGKRVVFSESNYRKLVGQLKEFIKKSRARFCVFADLNGYPIASAGSLKGVSIASLTALAAGDFSATLEMARMIGEQQQFKFIHHEGSLQHLYLCHVGPHYLLIVSFDQSVALGMIRILTRHTISKLQELLNSIEEDRMSAARFLDVEFRELLGKELDRAFGLKGSV